MEELIRKLNEDEKERLGNLLEQAHLIITDSENLDDNDIENTYETSRLHKGIEEVMYYLMRWC